VRIIKLLLGSSEDIFNALLKTDVHKACAQRAFVSCTITARVDDFVGRACAEEFDLAIFIAPDSLLPDPAQRGRSQLQEALRIVRTIRAGRRYPIIALSSQPEWESALLEAGVNRFLALPVYPADLEKAVAECLSPTLASRA
jgi:CheY-like chemotaxis protein